MTQQLSWIERLTTNQKARGSNPFWVTKLKLTRTCEFFYLSNYILWILQTNINLSAFLELEQACSNLQASYRQAILEIVQACSNSQGPYMDRSSQRQNRPVLIRRTLYRQVVSEIVQACSNLQASYRQAISEIVQACSNSQGPYIDRPSQRQYRPVLIRRPHIDRLSQRYYRPVLIRRDPIWIGRLRDRTGLF